MAREQRAISDYFRFDDERPFLHEAFEHARQDVGRKAFPDELIVEAT